MKTTNKFISLLITLTIFFNMCTVVFAENMSQKDYPQTFWDVPKTHWAFNYIAELVDKGVIAGYEDGSFQPENTVTRAEWAKIMVLAAGLKPQMDETERYSRFQFSDVSYQEWYAPYMYSALPYLNYYMSDMGDGVHSKECYLPEQAASREDVTVSMVKLKGYDVNKVDYSCLGKFTDVNSISNDLKKYVAVAVEKDLISGFEDNTFRGQATLTRAEAATLLWKAFQYGNDNKVVDAPTQQPITPTQQSDKPVVMPTTKPTPTEAPMTSEPSATPKQTPEPTPEPTATPKPYKIDTLVKANIQNSFCYTQDKTDNIYYIDNGTIFKVNIQSKNQEEIFNTESLIVDNDEMTLSDFSTESICYDNNRDSLLVLGKYKSVNAVNSVNNHYLYTVSDGGKYTILTDNYDNYTEKISGVLSNGDIVNDGHTSDGKTFEYKIYFSRGDLNEDHYEAYDFFEGEDGIYFLGQGDYYKNQQAFVFYDYVNSTVLWRPNVTFTAACTKDNQVIFMTAKNEICIYNFKGKQLNKITGEDCRVLDMTSIKFNNVTRKLIAANDSIIFYDTSAQAFRIITKND